MTTDNVFRNARGLQRIIELGGTDLSRRLQQTPPLHAYGRDAEIAQVFESVAERRSVLLLGPSDVGKTAILHEVAWRMALKHAPKALDGWHVVSISTGAVLAGTRYLGEWQTRLTSLLDAVKSAGNVVLYFEDIWTLRDAGRASDKTDGFATLIRSYLERGDVVLLGEATEEQYHGSSLEARALADDQAFVKLLNVIQLREPDRDGTKAILRELSRDLQRQRHVTIEPAALDRAVELARRFLPYQAFPGKATRLLDEATKRQDAGADGSTNGATPAGASRVITADTISGTFSALTGLPEKIISDAIPLAQEEILAYFEAHIVGQEEAVRTVADVVTLVKAELNDPGRPLGVLFFVGPTGVGKTELAKTLAEYLFGSKDKLIRFDMSEYKTYTGMQSLLQQLTERQRRQSFSVLLLDEIEKAGEFVFDLFLQAFDDARLTDMAGRSVDLRNTIIILTSNIGTGVMESRSIGFVEGRESASERRREAVQAVEVYFRPEFINRLDKIVVFQPLGREQMRLIAKRELGRALQREGVNRRNILLDFRDDVLDVLLTHGFSPTYGARPLQRAIKEHVLLPLARRIAAQPAVGEQLLELYAHDGGVDAALIPVNAVDVEDRDGDGRRAAAVPRDRQSVADVATGRPHMMDLARLQKELALVRKRILQHMTGARFQDLARRSEALLAEMGAPDFWDDQERARRTLSLAYHVERVTDRLKSLEDRADRLLEVAEMIRRHADVAGIPRLAVSFEQLERDLALAELELYAAEGATGTGTVYLRITPVETPRAREAGDWPATLQTMYVNWALRKGYDVECVSDDTQRPVLRLVGPNLASILVAEEGLHKLQEPAASKGTDRQRARLRLARVDVLRVPAMDETEVARAVARDATDGVGHRPDTPEVAEVVDVVTGWRVRLRCEHPVRVASELLLALAERAKQPLAGRDDEVARVYALGRTQYVRDPRTGERTPHPRDVLAGSLDGFLLAYLRQRRDEDVAAAATVTVEATPEP